jgi:hypothetical protein
MRTLQRQFWNGQPEVLRDLFTLTKPVARLRLHSHFFGFELKLTVNDVLVRSQVTRNPAEIDTLSTDWRTAMLKEGWQ